MYTGDNSHNKTDPDGFLGGISTENLNEGGSGKPSFLETPTPGQSNYLQENKQSSKSVTNRDDSETEIRQKGKTLNTLFDNALKKNFNDIANQPQNPPSSNSKSKQSPYMKQYTDPQFTSERPHNFPPQMNGYQYMPNMNVSMDPNQKMQQPQLSQLGGMNPQLVMLMMNALQTPNGQYRNPMQMPGMQNFPMGQETMGLQQQMMMYQNLNQLYQFTPQMMNMPNMNFNPAQAHAQAQAQNQYQNLLASFQKPNNIMQTTPQRRESDSRSNTSQSFGHLETNTYPQPQNQSNNTSNIQAPSHSTSNSQTEIGRSRYAHGHKNSIRSPKHENQNSSDYQSHQISREPSRKIIEAEPTANLNKRRNVRYTEEDSGEDYPEQLDNINQIVSNKPSMHEDLLMDMKSRPNRNKVNVEDKYDVSSTTHSSIWNEKEIGIKQVKFQKEPVPQSQPPSQFPSQHQTGANTRKGSMSSKNMDLDEIPLNPRHKSFKELLEENLQKTGHEYDSSAIENGRQNSKHKFLKRKSKAVVPANQTKKFAYFSDNFRKDKDQISFEDEFEKKQPSLKLNTRSNSRRDPEPSTNFVASSPINETKKTKQKFLTRGGGTGGGKGNKNKDKKAKSTKQVNKEKWLKNPNDSKTESGIPVKKTVSSKYMKKVDSDDEDSEYEGSKTTMAKKTELFGEMEEDNKVNSSLDYENPFSKLSQENSSKTHKIDKKEKSKIVVNKFNVDELNQEFQQLRDSVAEFEKLEEQCTQISDRNRGKIQVALTENSQNTFTQRNYHIKDAVTFSTELNKDIKSESNSPQSKMSTNDFFKQQTHTAGFFDSDNESDDALVEKSHSPAKAQLKREKDSEREKRESPAKEGGKSNLVKKVFYQEEERKKKQRAVQEKEEKKLEAKIMNEEVTNKIQELNEEISKFKQETQRVKKLKGEYDSLMKKLTKEMENFQKEKENELKEIQDMKDNELKKLKKERRVFERQTKAMQSMPNRKEKEEIDILKKEVTKLNEEIRIKDQRHKINNERLKKQCDELQAKNNELQQELKNMEQLRINSQFQSSPKEKPQETAVPKIKETTKRYSGNLAKAKSTTPTNVSSQAQPSMIPKPKFAKVEEKQETNKVSGSRNRNQMNRNTIQEEENESDHEKNEEESENEYELSDDEEQDNSDGFVQNKNVDPKAQSRNMIKDGESNKENEYQKYSQQSAGKIQSNINQTLIQKNSAPSYEGQKYMEEEKEVSEENEEQEEGPGSHRSSISEEEDYELKFPIKYHSTQPIRLINQRVSNDGKIKIQRLYENGKKEVIFHNGVRREIFNDGYTIVYFTNNDIKQTFPEGKVVYFFAEAKTTQTAFPDGLQVFKFANKQIEKHYPDGTKEISFPDGTLKCIFGDGEEESIFPDGTIQRVEKNGIRAIEFPNGQKDILFPDGTRIKEFPDGRVRKTFPDGTFENTFVEKA